MSIPKITIGIPTYQRAHFLKESLHCALSQKKDCIEEILVSDNASTDDTERVVRGAGEGVTYT